MDIKDRGTKTHSGMCAETSGQLSRLGGFARSKPNDVINALKHLPLKRLETLNAHLEYFRRVLEVEFELDAETEPVIEDENAE